MRKRRSYWREADARRELKRIAERGETDEAYLRRTGVAPSRLRWWRRRLARAHGADGGVAPASTFLPVRILDEPSAPSGAGIEVVVGGAHVLRVPVGFDAIDEQVPCPPPRV